MSFSIGIGDLAAALGGEAYLRQLADPNKTGQTDEAIAQGYIDSGMATVLTKVEVKHDPETIANLDEPSLRKLKDTAAHLAARVAYEDGGQGMAMPEWVEKRAERADKFLEDLTQGRARLGRVAGGAQAAINQPAGSVDHDPMGRKVSVTGFKRGFR